MKKQIAALFLRATGWRAEGRAPQAHRYVVIAAPHTSNWDLAYMLALAWVLGVQPRFMMKHTVFRGPAGWLFRRLGGIPIERRRPGGLVKQMVEAFETSESLALVVPPEGTRSRVDVWKSGFYQIARQANVPLVLSYLDYSRKAGGFGPALFPSGDVGADMDLIRAFYADKTGRYPERFGEIRLREEDLDEPPGAQRRLP